MILEKYKLEYEELNQPELKKQIQKIKRRKNQRKTYNWAIEYYNYILEVILS